jgi:tetratricopeptide (TPR) repeat protein
LERAIALRPDYDNARYQLALLEKNAGHAEAAIAQLRAMREVAPQRAFAYWSALSDALNEIGRNEEARAAAKRAAEVSNTPAERAHAAELGYVAGTELAVQMLRTDSGASRMVTTRVPRGSSEFNPFVEAGEEIRRTSGTLREIECGDPLRFLVETHEGTLALAAPDPSRLLARNSPSEFTCGPQPGAAVSVEYTTGGVLRGIDFR